MTQSSPDNAWNTFWERQNRAGGTAAGSGCVPEGWRGIAEMQARVWNSFARSLPKNARLLDLATGDGAVLRAIGDARRDCELLGVDRTTALPATPKGMTLRGGIDMEELPFEDDSFDAVTSQFGFEYGDIARIASEIARVLRPGGKLGLITHRQSGPIVSHNRNRREQIAWAITENSLPLVAKDSLKLRKSGVTAIPQALLDAPAEGAEVHGQGSAAWEIAEAILRTLQLGRNDDPVRVSQVIEDIEAQANNELGRIASLEKAASVASDADHVVEVLDQAGLAFQSEAMLTDGRSPKPFADYRTYIRKD